MKPFLYVPIAVVFGFLSGLLAYFLVYTLSHDSFLALVFDGVTAFSLTYALTYWTLGRVERL